MKRLSLVRPSFLSARSAPQIMKALILLSILVSITSGPKVMGQKKADGVMLEPYVFETYDKRKVEAELGRLTVPENRHRMRSNSVELAFIRFKSLAKLPASPIVFLSGGPGASGINEARGAAFPLLAALREIGDVIVLDQRGTGMSKPALVCDQTWGFPLNNPGTPKSGW